MLRLTPVAGDKLNPQLQSMLSAFHFDTGNAPNFLRILAKSPAASSAFTAAEQALANGQLSALQREQIALAVAEINNSGYCVVAHTVKSRDAGLSDEDTRLARKASANDPKAQAMLHFAQTVVLQRGNINDEDLRSVRAAGFSDVDVIEIIANVGLNIFTNYLNLISNTEADFPLLHPEGKKRGTGSKVSRRIL